MKILKTKLIKPGTIYAHADPEHFGRIEKAFIKRKPAGHKVIYENKIRELILNLYNKILTKIKTNGVSSAKINDGSKVRENMSNTMYVYREQGGSGNYVAMRIDRPDKNMETGPYYYKVSYAFCSSTDQFSRPLARELVDFRINEYGELALPNDNKNKGGFVVISSDIKLNAKELIEKALDPQYMEQSKHFPPWGSQSSNWRVVKVFKNKRKHYRTRMSDSDMTTYKMIW